jgi:RNA polymerase sigma-70 factor (ECF subfamily)
VKYIASRVPGSLRAEDLAQELFLRFMGSPHLGHVRDPWAYLRTIASHLIYEVHVRERREAVIFDSAVFEAVAERHAELSAEEFTEQVDARQRIATALSRLRPMLADVLLLRYGAGLSLNEIASECGISPHSSKKYLFLALSACRVEDTSSEP